MESSTDITEEPLDARKAFTPFDPSERRELKAFALHMADLNGLELANRKTTTMNINADGFEVEGVTKENVMALMSAYRKVALLNDDDGTFHRVRNILSAHAHLRETQEAATVLGYLKALKEFRKDLLNESHVMAYILENEDGTTDTIPPKTIIDWVVYGVVSHSDVEKRARWEALGGWDSGGLMMNIIVTVADDLQIFRGLDDLVKRVLESPELAAQ